MQEWAAALAFLVLSAVVGGSMLVAARVLRVRSRPGSATAESLKTMTYECGEEPEGPAWIKFNPRYYVVALVFVLFDVEAGFLFPWALNVRDMGGVAFVDMLIFVVVLLLGWAYALRKGALKWQ